MTDTSNRKAELLSSPVEHIDISSFDGRVIIDAWEKMSFTSRDAARAARILQASQEDKDCAVILTLAGSTSAGGCMHVWRDMIRNNMVDAVRSLYRPHLRHLYRRGRPASVRPYHWRHR